MVFEHLFPAHMDDEVVVAKLKLSGILGFHADGVTGADGQAATEAVLSTKQATAAVGTYTFVDDIVQGIELAMEYCADNAAVFNLGNSKPVKLGYFLEQIEARLGVKAKFEYQASNAEIKETYADITKAETLLEALKNPKAGPAKAVSAGVSAMEITVSAS